jgi:hypothetical protein
MLKERSLQIKAVREVEKNNLHFSLPSLLSSDQRLALNLETRTLALLADGPQLMIVQQFTTNELRIILPLLESYPHYCPYEVMIAHLSSSNVTMSSIARWQQRLQEAQLRGMWQQELRPLRRALTTLRVKLHAFNLEISNIRERGCSLTNLRA